MQKMKPSKREFPAWPRRLLLGLVVAGICCPTLIWGQADQRIPLELKVKLADGKIKIGQTFVESLKNRIKRSDTFRLSSSDIPRLVLRISSEDLPGDPLYGGHCRHPDRGDPLERRVQRDFCG